MRVPQVLPSRARGFACLTAAAVSGTALLELPPSLVAALGAACLATALVAALLARARRGRAAPPLSLEALLVAAGLTLATLAITAGSLAALPPRLFTVTLLPFRHLGVVLVAQMLALVALVWWNAVAPKGKGSLAVAALACVLVHATLNGDVHGLLRSDRAPLLFGVTLLAAYAVLAAERPLRAVPAPLAAAALLLVAAAGLASLAGFDPHEGLVRTAALANWVAVGALLVAGVPGARQVRRLLVVMLVVAAALAAAGLASALEVAARLGPGSLLGIQLGMARAGANGAGLFAAMNLVLCAGLAETFGRRRGTRALLLVAAPLLALALALSFSKAAACGFAAGVAVLALGRSTPWRRSRLVLGAAAGLAALALGASLLQRDSEAGVATRLILWKQALRTIAERPLLGIGPGHAFVSSFTGLMDAGELSRVRGWLLHTHAHDLPLAIAVATGLVGLAAFGALVFLALRHLARSLGEMRRASRGLVVALAAALAAWGVVHVAVYVLSERSLVGEAFFILLALAVVAGDRHRGRTLGAEDRRLARVPGARDSRVFVSFALAAAALLVVARPVVARRLLDAGEKAFRSGRAGEGRRLFGAAARLSPFDAELLDRWGAREGGPEGAAAPWRRAAALRPRHAPYQDRLGWLAWLQGDLAAARRFFTEAIRLDPEAVGGGPYQAHLAYLARHEGRRDEAVALLRESFRRHDRFVDGHDWAAASREEDVVLSSAYDAAAGELAPELRQAILRHLGFRDSVPDLRPRAKDAIRLEEIALPAPSDGADRHATGLLLRLVDVYRRLGMPERSARVAELVESRFGPREPVVLWTRARRLAAAGRFAEAVGPAAALAESAPSLQARHALAVALAGAGARADAAERARELLREPAGLGALSPVSAYQWLELSGALERAGARDEALRAAERAAFASPGGDVYAASDLAMRRLRGGG